VEATARDAAYTHPGHPGVWITQKSTCTPPWRPPPNTNGTYAALSTTGEAPRHALGQHSSSPALARLLEGIGSGALREDLPPLLMVAATMSMGFMPVIARRLALGAAPELLLPPPAEMAEKLTVALLAGIGAHLV